MEIDRADIVDGHVHFWDRTRFEYAWLDGDAALGRNFVPADLAERGLGAMVFVQADCRADQSIGEAAWVNELAIGGAPIIAIVAQAPLELGTRSAAHLAKLAEIPLVAGVRRLLQDEGPGFAVQPDFVRGVQLLTEPGFAFDLCIREHQLREVTLLVEQCPEVQFVLDHLGKPTTTTDAFPGWAADLSRLAAFPNVRCKLSGLASEASAAQRTFAGLSPWLQHAIDVFGPDRCLFGSDWPVVTTAGGYDAWLAIVTDALEALTPAEQTQVMHSTARDTYRAPRTP